MKAKCWLSPLHTCPVATAMCWPERGPLCLFGRSMKGLSYLRGELPTALFSLTPCSTAYLPTIPPAVLHPHGPGAYCDAALSDMLLHKTHVNLKLRDKVAVIWPKADTERWDCSASLHPAVVSRCNRKQGSGWGSRTSVLESARHLPVFCCSAVWNHPFSFMEPKAGPECHYRHQWAAMVPQEPSLCCPGRARCLPLIHRLLTI